MNENEQNTNTPTPDSGGTVDPVIPESAPPTPADSAPAPVAPEPVVAAAPAAATEPAMNVPVAPMAPPAPTSPAAAYVSGSEGVNGPMPAELRGWNWGAFLMNWVWAVAHNVWIGLLTFVPFVGWIMMFVLGAKGNEWAWQHRKFESVEQFKSVQRAWARWGIITTIAVIVILTAMYVWVLTSIGNYTPSSGLQSDQYNFGTELEGDLSDFESELKLEDDSL